MRRQEFSRIPEFEDLDDTSGLNVGDRFLYGINVRGQKQNKRDGEEVCYYQVISKSNAGIEYTPVFDVLEKDKGEDKHANERR
jgi:hypothetical protein